VAHLLAWINDRVAPEVLRRNEARVLRAIPQPPQIKVDAMTNSLWVLECEVSMRQGTAFMLRDTGLVTCQHVLGPETKAFQATSFSNKFAVNVQAQDPTVDLAVLGIQAVSGALESGSADGLRQMDHLVIAGFPNYRVGDSGTVVPGLVVGFRVVSGIRRILTNAPIVSGGSGSPVLDRDGKVIGVAATGTSGFESSQATEHQSVIPIDALRFLKAGS
jgi:S1-C subfamily serine protease